MDKEFYCAVCARYKPIRLKIERKGMGPICQTCQDRANKKRNEKI